jgi:hypothetical protein
LAEENTHRLNRVAVAEPDQTGADDESRLADYFDKMLRNHVLRWWLIAYWAERGSCRPFR